MYWFCEVYTLSIPGDINGFGLGRVRGGLLNNQQHADNQITQ